MMGTSLSTESSNSKKKNFIIWLFAIDLDLDVDLLLVELSSRLEHLQRLERIEHCPGRFLAAIGNDAEIFHRNLLQLNWDLKKKN